MLKKTIYLIIVTGALLSCAGTDIVISEEVYEPLWVDPYVPFDSYRYYGHERAFYRYDMEYGRPEYQYIHNRRYTD